MSYILDALRKSERERRRASVPDPLSVQQPFFHKKRRFFKSFYLLLIALVTGALLSGLGFGIWLTKNSAGQKAVLSQARHEPVIGNTEQVIAGIRKEGSDKSRHGGIKDAASTATIHTPAPERLPRNGSARTTVQKGADTDQKIAPLASAAPSVESGVGKEMPPADKGRLYGLNELPESVRQRLPDFTFSVFLYSDDVTLRTVRINGVTMKEGQYLADGLKLEEIIHDGVIFNYANYRFRVRVM